MTTRSRGRGRLRLVPILIAFTVIATSCYFPKAWRVDNASGGTEVASWCQGDPDLGATDCNRLSVYFDFAVDYANDYRTLADFTAAGATEVVDRPAGIGVAYALPGCCASFDPTTPSILLYSGMAPDSRLVGIGWGVDGAEPAGFDGDLDEWTQVSGRWFLSAWVIRGYLNQPDVFAASHPCLVAGAVYTDTSSPCFLASHTEPLEVLVTNDDGIGAPGIDAIVEALRTTPGINVTVVAPAANQSGTGDTVTSGGAPGAPGVTASGFAGTAVSGTPGDSVIYAINVAKLAPDLVVSGINLGQNMGPVTPISGTVGAAKWASRFWIPAIATSQGATATPDWPAGVAATLELVEGFRLGNILNDVDLLINVNIPSCAAGSSVRGTVEDTVLAESLAGRNYGLQDCTSTKPIGDIFDDIDAFNNGFVGITQIPS